MLVEQTEASWPEREALDSRRTTLEQEEAALKEKARQAEEMLAAVRREEAASQEKAHQAEERLAAARMLQRWGAQRIADWAGEAKSALVPLGFSPIRVDAAVTPFADASPVLNSVADALPVLDSAAERLGHLNEVLNAQLESEGRELSRVVAEHNLVCLQSHDPTISLAPIVAGPVPAAEESARERGCRRSSRSLLRASYGTLRIKINKKIGTRPASTGVVVFCFLYVKNFCCKGKIAREK